MSDEAPAPVPEAVAAEAPAPAAVDVAPVAETPVVEAPAVVETAPEAAAPAAEAEAASEETAAEPAAEAAAAEDAAPEAAEASAEPAKPEPPKYEDWKVPEGMSLDTERSSALSNIFGKYGLSQEAGQEIVDFGASYLRAQQERMEENQREVFAEMRRGWVQDFEKDSGNRRNTMLNDAKTAIREALPDEKQRAALWEALAITGAGDHPAVIRAWANIGKRLRERAAPSPGLPADPNRNMRPADRRYAPKN